MRKKILSVLFLFIMFFCFLLQCTVFKTLSFGGISPNLLIITTTSVGFMRGEKQGLLAGFVSGLFIDIFFGDVIGLYALLYMYIGFLNGKFSRIFYPEDIKLPLALITLSDLSYGMVCYIVLFLLRGRLNFPYFPLFFPADHSAGSSVYDRDEHYSLSCSAVLLQEAEHG